MEHLCSPMASHVLFVSEAGLSTTPSTKGESQSRRSPRKDGRVDLGLEAPTHPVDQVQYSPKAVSSPLGVRTQPLPLIDFQAKPSTHIL